MSENTQQYAIGYITAGDGTKIGYRQLGAGPGLMLVHGAMMTSANFMSLAGYLAADFTVYIPDRHGRALSGKHEKPGLQIEAADIQALAKHTAAQNIFGLSSGAIISLQAALNTPSLKKIALYEPPIPADSTVHSDWYAAYERAVVKGDFGKAFVAIIKGTGDASFFSALPSFITAPLMNLAIKQEDKNEKDGVMSLKSLIATFPYDYKILRESEGITEKAKNLQAQVLLLGGNKSLGYLLTALDRLMTAIPHAKKIIFPKAGHIAADNSGKPQMVAKELSAFFNS